METIAGTGVTGGGVFGLLTAVGVPDTDWGLILRIAVALVSTGGIGGGLWLVIRTMLDRQEARIGYLEKQNGDQQKVIDEARAQGFGYREQLARLEERLAGLTKVVQQNKEDHL